MAIEFCPLEADWGNWGDWAAVLVGAAAAVGTIWVAWLAQTTSAKATRIAAEAKEIAMQQHAEAISLREGTARILGNLLRVEISILPVKLGAVIEKLDTGFDFATELVENRDEVAWVLQELDRTFLPSGEEVQERLHNLPAVHGDGIAGLIGMSRGLVDTSRRIAERFTWVSRPNGSRYLLQYGGDDGDLAAMRNQLISMLRIAILVAQGFAGYVGRPTPDYEHETRIAGLR